MTAQQVLDQAYTLARLDALAADPDSYARALAAELPATATPAELEARDAMLATALGQIDAVAVRAMRLGLDRAEVGLAAATRTLFATTVVAYAGELELLHRRAHEAAARGRTADPASDAGAVVEAARGSLALREALRAGVLGLIARCASESVAAADRNARERTREEPERRRWSAIRRELEGLAAQPERIAAAPFARRIAAQPEQLDEAEPVPEATFAEMIELD